MNNIFSITKSAIGIFGTFILIQIIIGIPSILIFKINFSNKEFCTGLIILNIVSELILIYYYIHRFGLYKKFLSQFENIYFYRLLIGLGISFMVPIFFYFLLYMFNDGNFINGNTSFKEQIGIMFSIFILAMCEELLCRFIMLEKFITISSKLNSILISTLFFMALHLGNPGMSIFAAFNLLLFGFLLSLIYYKTKDLLLITIIHFGWNYTTGCLIGSNVSGIKLPSLFKYIGGKSVFLDGDKFGIEGSPITLLGIILIIGVYTVYSKRVDDKLIQ